VDFSANLCLLVPFDTGSNVSWYVNTEVFLMIDNAGANYSVGTAQYDNGTGNSVTNGATYPVPVNDIGGNTWIHLVGTYDGAKWNLYRNGALVASHSAAGALSITNGNWAIGATGNGWGDNYVGNVDEVAIYNKALSASQVAAHYVAGLSGTANLSIVKAAGGKVTITWPNGTKLLQSSTLNGTYTVVPGSPVSPLSRWREMLVPPASPAIT